MKKNPMTPRTPKKDDEGGVIKKKSKKKKKRLPKVGIFLLRPPTYFIPKVLSIRNINHLIKLLILNFVL